MSDLLRYLASIIFGTTWVVLIDHDGSRHVRRIRWQGGVATAERVGFDIRRVQLLDHGKIGNGAYVHAWEPYSPLAARRWPIPPEATRPGGRT